ncbi:hypothetical protein QN239_26845 [Mycolicibacterium sp. Y3]
MKPTIAFGTDVVELTEDATGYIARVDIAGQPHLIHVTATPCGPRVVTPAKWCAGC